MYKRQAFLSVVYGVKGGKHGQEHLGGADVGGRLVAANMLDVYKRQVYQHPRGRLPPRRVKKEVFLP